MLLGTAGGLAYLARQPTVEGLLAPAGGGCLVTPGFERYVTTWYPDERDR
jgi:hypothetical protein